MNFTDEMINLNNRIVDDNISTSMGVAVKEAVFERIDSLMEQQERQHKELHEHLKLGERTYNNWKNGKSSTYLQHIDEIAKFLGVTPNYLITGDDKYSSPNKIEEELIDLFRTLSETRQRWLLNVVKAIIAE